MSGYTECRPVWLLPDSHDESHEMGSADYYGSAMDWETQNWAFPTESLESADLMQVTFS